VLLIVQLPHAQKEKQDLVNEFAATLDSLQIKAT
jgi:hypothetical protein